MTGERRFIPGSHTSDTGPDNRSHPVFVDFVQINFAVPDRLICRNDGILSDRVKPSCLFSIEIIVRIVVFYLTGKFSRQIFRIEMCDGSDPALTRYKTIPELRSGTI